MRNAVAALLALALTAAPAPAQQSSWADRMFKDGAIHDFGTVARGAQLLHRFKITNIYAARLDIINTRTSCGCVTITPSVRTLEPRQEAYIDVLMDARRFTGQKAVSIYVTVGPEFVSTATLQVSAYSRVDVVFNPGQVNFGLVPRGQAPTQVIDVDYAGTLTWTISEVIKPPNAPLDVTFKERHRRPGQVGYAISVTLKPDAPPGALKQELFLKTNDQASQLVPLLVEATIQAPLTVSPGTVSLGAVKAGTEVSRRVMVKGGQPFRIVGIEGLGDGVRADVPPATAQMHFVTLVCQPGRPGEFRRQLQIRTDLPGEGPATVTLEGRVEP